MHITARVMSFGCTCYVISVMSVPVGSGLDTCRGTRALWILLLHGHIDQHRLTTAGVSRIRLPAARPQKTRHVCCKTTSV